MRLAGRGPRKERSLSRRPFAHISESGFLPGVSGHSCLTLSDDAQYLDFESLSPLIPSRSYYEAHVDHSCSQKLPSENI